MPLICNFVVVNTINPTTDVDKRVAKRFEEIIKTYGLASGRKINFAYPKELITQDKENPGRKIYPASFLIRFDGTRRTDKGQEHWRYYQFEKMLPNGKKEYKPASKIFDGALELGQDDIELIYFLLDIYPRTVGGANKDARMFPMVEVKDLVAEAKARVEEKRSRASINAKLYLDEDEGGYSEQQLRDVASRLFIPNASTDDIDIVRDSIDSKLKSVGDDAFAIFNRTVKTVEGTARSLAQKLADAGIVKISPVKGSGASKAWVEVLEDGSEKTIVVISKFAKNDKVIELLSDFLRSASDVADALSARLEGKLSADNGKGEAGGEKGEAGGEKGGAEDETK